MMWRLKFFIETKY